MSFGQAVSSGFSNYANFSGRTPRSGYWWWVLFTIIVSAVASGIDNVAGLNFEGQNAGWVSAIAGLAVGLVIVGIALVIGKAFGKNLSFAEGHAAPQAHAAPE